MEKPDNSVLVNVHVTPSDEVGDQCVKISQSLKSDGTMFVLDRESKFPHMTVFMFRVANDRVAEVVKAVEQVVSNLKSFPCRHTGYFMTAGRYFEASYEKTPEFVGFHEELISALKDLRINPGQPYEEGYFTPYTAKQQANAKETGYDLAHGLFRPHVTLTRYFEGQVPEKDPQVSPVDMSFQLQEVCVYKADDNGAVYEPLAKFFLG